MKNITIKKLTILSVLLAMCIAISIADSYVSNLIFPFLPTIKIGIANIIIVLVIYQYKFHEGLIVTLLKSVIVGLLFSGITSFVIGGTASLVSFLLMYLVKRVGKDNVSMIGVSLVGGFSHIITQLLVVALIYKLGSTVFAYGLYLILISLFTSVLVGFVSLKCNMILDKLLKKDSDDNTNDIE